MRRFGVRTVFVTALLTALTMPIESAKASNWAGRSGQTGCSSQDQADDQNHCFWYVNLTSAMASATNYTRTYVYNPTRVNTHNASSLMPATDAVVFDEDYRDFCGLQWDHSLYGVAGFVHCVSRNSANECEKHEIRYDTSDTNSTAQHCLS